MWEISIPPNWAELVQKSLQESTPENIYLKDTWFMTNLEDYPIGVTNNKPLVSQQSDRITPLPPNKKHKK